MGDFMWPEVNSQTFLGGAQGKGGHLHNERVFIPAPRNCLRSLSSVRTDERASDTLRTRERGTDSTCVSKGGWMDLQPGVDQRLVFILREPREPVISGVEKAIPELRALVSAHSLSPPRREASSSGHSVGPSCPALSCVYLARLLPLQQTREAPATHRHLSCVASAQEGWVLGSNERC